MEKLGVKDFDEIFAIMEKSFPSDEHRPYEEQKALFSKERYTVYGERKEGKLQGFLATWHFDDFLFIEHFAVDSNLRGGGIGSRMLKELVEKQTVPTCLEVELPENELSRRRIGFYQRGGFFYNEYEYIQPPISKGKMPLPLRIMSSGKTISETEFETIRAVLYKEVYGVPVER